MYSFIAIFCPAIAQILGYRFLRELQTVIRRTNGGNLTCRQTWLLRRIQNKFVQMVARLKATQRKEILNIPNAKYPTGIVIDLKSPQGNVFYLMGLANRLIRELGLSVEEIAEFKRKQTSATTYLAYLALLRKWFGIVFVGDKNS